MAARATISMSATLGIAAATLVVMGGILAGPVLVECSNGAGDLGACLREKLAESGLLAPAPQPGAVPMIISALPSAPAIPTEVTTLAPPTGWMEANANELSPLTSAPVELAGVPLEIEATELVPVAPPVAEAAVTPVTALAATSLPAAPPAIAVELNAAAPGLLAGASTPPEPVLAEVALAGPVEQVVATSPVVEMPSAGVALAAEPATPAIAVAVAADPSPSGPAAVDLRPEMDVALPPEPPPTPEPVQPAEPAPERPVPAPEPPARVVEYNPAFPNVLVLPPPASGPDSSFSTLELN